MKLQIGKTSNGKCDLLAALILTFHFINGVVGIGGISVIVIGIVFLLAVFKILTGKIRIYVSALFILLFVLLAFLISYGRLSISHITDQYIKHFLAFCVISLIIGSQPIEVQGVIYRVVWIGALGLPVCLLRGFSNMAAGNTMGLSYAILPVLCSSLIALLLYRKMIVLALFNTLISLYTFVLIAPRGIWLSLAFFSFCLIYYRITSSSHQGVTVAKKMFFLVLSVAVVVLVIQNIYELVTVVNNFFRSTFGVSIKAFEKFLNYHNINNVLNGRDDLWEDGITYIRSNFFIGHGIGFFETNHGGSYSHNILIQSLCEMGVFFFVPIMLLLLSAVKFLLFSGKKVTYEEFCYTTMIITCGIFILFFSSVYWIWVPFWYAVAYIIQLRRKLKNTVQTP